MKILLAHNYYQQPGGEDQSYAAEIAMLEAYGHQIIPYRIHNDSIENMSRLGIAARTIWNRSSFRDVRALVRKHRPHIAHFNNTFPLISPAAYYAARTEGVPVVQTLRNYRLLCPNAFFFRNQQVCEACLGKLIAWPGIMHGCYRQSASATAVVAGMLAVHRLLRTWQNAVDVYIALTEFGRKKFLLGGLPAEKVMVKPNFIYPDPGPGNGQGGYAIFVGRLSEEKGLQTLLDAWRLLAINVPLKIVGDGPLDSLVRDAALTDERIEWIGHRTSDEVANLVGDAAFLLFPSLWYEGMPRTILEAFAKGTPVIASQLGAMQELIKNHHTGVLFEPGQADHLATLVGDLWADFGKLRQMRKAVRAEYENLYTFEPNYQMLMAVYQRALESRNMKKHSREKLQGPYYKEEFAGVEQITSLTTAQTHTEFPQ
jgi:glycosyltransferase involved in cell wall biosynthesis